MKKKNVALADKDRQKLLGELAELKEKYVKLRVDKGLSKVQKTSDIRDVRKNIARHFTYLNQQGAYEKMLEKQSSGSKRKKSSKK